MGAIGLRLRDVWVVSNVSVALLLLLTGVNLPRGTVPHWMESIGQFLPITHAAEAARRLTTGQGIAVAIPALLTEVAVGLSYAVLATALLRIFELESRKYASLDAL